MLREIVEAKKISMKNLPKEIPGGEYDDTLTLYKYNKSEGSYEYTQIEPSEFGDYGDEGEKYNQGYTLECDFNITQGILYLDVIVTDLGKRTQDSFGKKYGNYEFDDISEFTNHLKKIVKEFDKI